MICKIEERRETGKNLGVSKEMVGAYSIVCHQDGKLVEAVTARSWMGRSRNAERVYATIWAKPSDGSEWFSGHDYAGGYGYHKESSAFEGAASRAGFLFEDREGNRLSWGGSGDSAMWESFEAIARALGYTGECMLIRHG